MSSSFGQKTYDEINSFDLLHLALGSGPWYVEFDEKGEIKKCQFSQVFRNMLGYKDTNDFPDTAEAFDRVLYEEDFDRTVSLLHSALSDSTGHKDFIAEYRLYTKNRGIRWFKSIAKIVRRKDNSPLAIIGMFVDIDDKKRYQERINQAVKAQVEELRILTEVANTFYSMHYFDLSTDTFTEYYAAEEIKAITSNYQSARKVIKGVMDKLVIENDQERVKKFCNLDTLARRMMDVKSLSAEFIGVKTGWFLANFICVDKDSNGIPVKFLFTTQAIDEYKQKERTLFIRSMTDELTGLLNRRSYETELKYFHHHEIHKDLVFISIDINGLKPTNDRLGHAAGDELIRGVADCIRKMCAVYDEKAKAFRVGGDEFVVWFNAADTKPEDIKKCFGELTENYRGTMICAPKVSFGAVTGLEAQKQNMSISEVMRLADKRMYTDKKQYYKYKGEQLSVQFEE